MEDQEGEARVRACLARWKNQAEIVVASRAVVMASADAHARCMELAVLPNDRLTNNTGSRADLLRGIVRRF